MERTRATELEADALVEALQSQIPTLDLRVTPQAQCDWINPESGSAWPGAEDLTAWRDSQVELLRGYYARIEAGVGVPFERFNDLVEELLQRLARNPARFTQLALLCPRREDYLPDHAFTVGVLAMGIATHLGWPLNDVRRVGQAGLLFDVGMLMLAQPVRTGPEELSGGDCERVKRHPILGLVMLKHVQGVPDIVRLAALQHHERENGTGYPFGWRRDAICDFAKVLGVGDAFAATTEPRQTGKRKLPYTAMEEILHSPASAAALWKPAVRGLLQAAGLFPVGSFVKLSNGKNAHVIAANPRQLDRPIVQVVNSAGDHADASIDLASVAATELSVVRPITE